MLLVGKLLSTLVGTSPKNPTSLLKIRSSMASLANSSPRSFMIVPATNRDLMKSCMTSFAEAVIVDLEDFVEPVDKDRARIDAAAWLESHLKTPSNVSIGLRINNLKTGFGADDFCYCFQFIESHINLVYPQVDSVHDLKEFESLVISQTDMEPKTKLNVPVNLILDIESAMAFVNLKEIVQYAEKSQVFRLKGLIFGAFDYIRSLGRYPEFYDTTYLDPPRTELAQIARAYDLMAIDMITESRDLTLVGLEAIKAYNLGYTSKLSTKPIQNEVINDSMVPPVTLVEWAEEVKEKFEDALKNKMDHIVQDGKTIRKSVYEHAKQILQLRKVFEKKDK